MRTHRTAWNKGRLLGQKPPLKPKEIGSLRIRLQLASKTRGLAMFNRALDSKPRGCDLISLRVSDGYRGNTVAARAIVMQRNSALLHQRGKPVSGIVAASSSMAFCTAR
jgi:hypothetical protein